MSALALRSKGYWGYSAAFLESCRAELTIWEPQLGEVTVAAIGDVPVAFSLMSPSQTDPDVALLNMLFVDVPHIGSGIGRRLLTEALDTATNRGFRAVVLDADPGAERFYLRNGAQRVGESQSGSIAGRTLPRLEFTLEGD